MLLWLESFGNPRKFARLARALASRKPVIALKSGRHALVSPGLAASSAEVSASAVETLFAQSGVLRVDTLTQAFDLTMVLAHQPLPAGDRVAIIANSTALGILALDACLDRGLQVAGGRPIDLGIAVDPAMLAFTARSAIYDEDVDAVVVVYVPPVATDGLRARRRVAGRRGQRRETGGQHVPRRAERPRAPRPSRLRTADWPAVRCRPIRRRSARSPPCPAPCGTRTGSTSRPVS